MTWLKEHWPTVAAVLLVVLPALATALARYPKASGAVRVLQVVADFLSVLTHRDSPGTLKFPCTRSKDPEVLR